MINVFDATGYLNAGKYVVLQNNLYGEGELDDNPTLAQDAKDKDLILNPEVTSQNDDKVVKTLIYGNGNQVNFKVLNDKITPSMLNPNGQRNTGNPSRFERIYNLTFKGCNPVEKVTSTKVKLFPALQCAYYSDIQFYSKMNHSGTVYFKNTVFRNVADVALQLYRDQSSDPSKAAETAYLENIVMENAVHGIGLENGYHTLKIKGGFDILNYHDKEGYTDMLGAEFVDTEIVSGTGITYYDAIIGELHDFLEWHGAAQPQKEEYYANLAIFMSELSGDEPAHFTLSTWDDETKTYVEAKDNKVSLADGSMLQDVRGDSILLSTMILTMIHLWTYGSPNALDGATVEAAPFPDASTPLVTTLSSASKDLTKVFSKDRYIRLLCEYKNKGVKNDEHILWHIQKAYRDLSLIEGRIQDHEKALKHSLVGTTWPDGTLADNYF